MNLDAIKNFYTAHKNWVLPAVVAVAVFILAQIGMYSALLFNDNPLPSGASWGVSMLKTSNTPETTGIADESLTAEVLIEKLGIDVPIVWSGSTKDADLEKDLEHGAIHYPGTPRPGEHGNSFVTAHSSDYPWKAGNYKQAFVKLGNLNMGDDIVVVYKKDGAFVYRAQFKVVSKEVVSSTDIRMIEQGDATELTLATCWPIGTNWKRLMVKAELVSLTTP